jgi:tRNA (guanine-N7-)-methyltransferase
MGRRALRKIDPRMDLSRHLKTLEELPRPFSAEALFGRVAPLEIEVGSGKGLFLRTAAAACRDSDFLGIEVAPRYARFSAAGLARRGLSNAVMVAGDAGCVFAELLPAGAVAAVHVYFPDPWWKRRHKKRRVIRENFVQDIERALKPGGLLHYWTDVEEYFQTGVAMISSQTHLEGPFDVPESPTEGDLDYRTHFERRTRLSGGKVYRAQFRKPPSE